MKSVLVAMIVGLVLLLLFKKNSSNCSNCEENYDRCMQHSSTASKQEQCSNIFCSNDCETCGSSTTDCSDANASSCQQMVDIPKTCITADPNQIYFNSSMCAKDLEELCNDPDARQQLCSQGGAFAHKGSTPCCDVCKAYKSGVSENFHSQNTIPPFQYPADIQQPFGPQGWGYRDPQATYRTLIWDQTRPTRMMPDFNQDRLTGYLDMSVPSAPVPKRCSPFEGTAARPETPSIRQQPVATSNYTNWASTLQA